MTSSGRSGDFDDLPAYGLREDVFDDRLRAGYTRYDPEDLVDEDVKYPLDPAVWLARNRVSQSEVSLHLGRTLLQSPIIDSNVVLTLAGYELTRSERPQFPVSLYLTDTLGFTPKVNRPKKWVGHYALPGVERRLVLHYDRHDGHLSVRLTTGDRLIVFVSGGRMHSKRGSAEHRMIYSALGRAVAWVKARPTDHLAICVPRSGAFRKAILEFKKADRIQRMRIHMLTVERVTGSVGGLGYLEALCMEP